MRAVDTAANADDCAVLSKSIISRLMHTGSKIRMDSHERLLETHFKTRL